MYCLGDWRSIALRHPLALALTDFFALQRHRPHPLVERVGDQIRHGERQHRRDRGDAGEEHRHDGRIERL
jgi:hypothetical protein